MRTLLKKFFLSNWPRKCLAVILAIIFWYITDKTLTITKTIPNVPVRIQHIPPGKTVADIQSNGILNKRATLTITGNKTLLEDLSGNDIEVVFDAASKEGEWIATISKRNIRTNNPDINISHEISKVVPQNFLIKLTNLVTEKIPITITEPIGEAPKGYQFLDIWPYELYITVSGPEDKVKSLKERGLKITFNLSDIAKSTLDELHVFSNQKDSNVVTYFIPNHWKQILLPFASSTPIEINDPDGRLLRMDFLRHELFKIENPIPVVLFFPFSEIKEFNPQKIHLLPHPILQNKNGLNVITKPLYAKGVSHFFLHIIKDMLQLVILVSPKGNNQSLDWSLQFVNSRTLEDLYTHTLMSDISDEKIHDLQLRSREDYLRHRFRSYMNRLELFTSDHVKFKICPILQDDSIHIKEKIDDKK